MILNILTTKMGVNTPFFFQNNIFVTQIARWLKRDFDGVMPSLFFWWRKSGDRYMTVIYRTGCDVRYDRYGDRINSLSVLYILDFAWVLFILDSRSILYIFLGQSWKLNPRLEIIFFSVSLRYYYPRLEITADRSQDHFRIVTKI